MRTLLPSLLRLTVAGAAAVALTACGTAAVPEAAPVTVTGGPLPVYAPETGSDPAVGMAAPQVEGVDFDGNPVSIGEGPALVVFVAHWCPHCQSEVPHLVDWVAGGGDLPIVLVPTAEAPERGNHPASDWLARVEWTGPVLRDDKDNSALTAYGIPAFPAFVAVDADGRVAVRSTGPLADPDAALDQLAAALTN